MRFAIICFLLAPSLFARTVPKTIHVFVALCDNKHQGIVPVPQSLGNGADLRNNLYWGAMYGVRSYLKRSKDWVLVGEPASSDKRILQRCIFRHRTQNVYLVADAWNGKEIRGCLKSFLAALAGQGPRKLAASDGSQRMLLSLDGAADLCVYVGHNGLMEFNLPTPKRKGNTQKPAIVLCCKSKPFFSDHFRKLQADPVLMTTNFMAPEAYIIEAAVGAWIRDQPANRIRLSAAAAYNKYQKCGMRGAKRLFNAN